MDWINHKLYIDPIGTFIDPNFPVDKAIGFATQTDKKINTPIFCAERK